MSRDLQDERLLRTVKDYRNVCVCFACLWMYLSDQIGANPEVYF